MNYISPLLKQCEETRATVAIAEREFPTLVELTNSLPDLFYCYFYPSEAKIICHAKTREAFAPLRTLRHGVWNKCQGEDEGEITFRYEGVLDCGVTVVCHVRELPPSCRIVETEELVPAAAEHLRKVRKIKCDAVTKEEVARELAHA